METREEQKRRVEVQEQIKKVNWHKKEKVQGRARQKIGNLYLEQVKEMSEQKITNSFVSYIQEDLPYYFSDPETIWLFEVLNSVRGAFAKSLDIFRRSVL